LAAVLLRFCMCIVFVGNLKPDFQILVHRLREGKGNGAHTPDLQT
jgi:hypothetical protein